MDKNPNYTQNNVKIRNNYGPIFGGKTIIYGTPPKGDEKEEEEDDDDESDVPEADVVCPEEIKEIPDKPSAPIDFGFVRSAILSMITAEHKAMIADILIEQMGRYVNKNKPKEGLLPFYCAIYEINWIATRPEYLAFIEAFPHLINNPTSYKNYIPTTRQTSNYHKKSCHDVDIERMCETLQAALKERLSR